MNEVFVENVRDVNVSDEDGFSVPQHDSRILNTFMKERIRIKRATSEVVSLPLVSQLVLCSSELRFFRTQSFFHAPVASNFERVLHPRAVILPHTLLFSTLRNVNTRVDAVREALNMKARTVYVCLCLALLYNLKLRMRICVLRELFFAISNCESEFESHWN